MAKFVEGDKFYDRDELYDTKDDSKLRLARSVIAEQVAILVGSFPNAPQAPTVFDPLVNQRAARVRRNEVLHAMFKNGYITAAKLRSATRKKLVLRPGHLYTQQHQPNFFGWATQQLPQSLGKNGQRQVELGGLHV